MNPSLSALEAHSLNPQELAQLVRSCYYFDEQWYRQNYPEIEYHENGNPDPAFHYANYGYKEQRLPSVLFDGNKYSSYHHLDSDINPLLHYVASGCPGDYRAHEQEQQLLVKLTDNQELCPSERALLLENSYKAVVHKQLNLAAIPATLSEKFYFLRAYHTKLWEKSTALFDLRVLGNTLQTDFGFSKEQAPEPFLVLNSSSEFTQEIFDSLPENFFFMCNGLSAATIKVANKSQVALEQITQILQNIEKQIDSNLAEHLSAHYGTPFAICFFKPLHSESTAIEFNVLCLNGQATLVAATGPEHSLNLFDPSFNLIPCSLANDEKGIRPNFNGLDKPESFDEMLAKAAALSAGLPSLAVRFKLLADGSFVCQEVRPDLFNGDFILTGDYDLKLGAAFNLNYLFKA